MAVVVVALFGSPASGGVRLTGSMDALELQAEDVELHEVLQQLSRSYRFRFQSVVPLNQIISGTYTGSLQQIVNRLLAGNQFVTRLSGHEVSLVVYAMQKGGARVVEAPSPPTPVSQDTPKAPPPRGTIPNPKGVTDSGYVR
jgi:hypothetical protein